MHACFAASVNHTGAEHTQLSLGGEDSTDDLEYTDLAMPPCSRTQTLLDYVLSGTYIQLTEGTECVSAGRGHQHVIPV